MDAAPSDFATFVSFHAVKLCVRARLDAGTRLDFYVADFLSSA